MAVNKYEDRRRVCLPFLFLIRSSKSHFRRFSRVDRAVRYELNYDAKFARWVGFNKDMINWRTIYAWMADLDIAVALF